MAYVNLIDLVYPVGAVYISYRSDNPVNLFGGSWTAITGRFPYFNAGTDTGGSNTHTRCPLARSRVTRTDLGSIGSTMRDLASLTTTRETRRLRSTLAD